METLIKELSDIDINLHLFSAANTPAQWLEILWEQGKGRRGNPGYCIRVSISRVHYHHNLSMSISARDWTNSIYSRCLVVQPRRQQEACLSFSIMKYLVCLQMSRVCNLRHRTTRHERQVESCEDCDCCFHSCLWSIPLYLPD